MNEAFTTLHHVCVASETFDAAVALYESIGVGPWHDFPSLEPFRGELDVPSVDDFFKLRYRYANLGNTSTCSLTTNSGVRSGAHGDPLTASSKACLD